MIATGFDVGAGSGAPKLPCLKTPRLLDDKKTFVLLCTSDPGKAYVLAFNAAPQGGFANAAEHRADPATLSFTTTDANGPIDVHTALKAAGLQGNGHADPGDARAPEARRSLKPTAEALLRPDAA